jgi:hypothetical protein
MATKERKSVSDEVFLDACNRLRNVKQIAAETGMAAGSVSARKTRMSKEYGIVFPEFTRAAGGRRVDKAAIQELARKLNMEVKS